MQSTVAAGIGLGALRGRAARLGSAAFQWWIAELAGMLPKSLAGYLQRTRSPACVLLLNRDGLQVEWTDRGRQSIWPVTDGAQLPKPVAEVVRHGVMPVRLHQGLAFQTNVRMPAQAEANLDQILDHHVGLLVPLEPQDVSYRYVVTARDLVQNAISIDIAIVKKQTIAILHQKCTSLQLRPKSIHIDGDARNFDFIGSALAADPFETKSVRRILTVVAAGLVLLAFGVMEWRRVLERRALDAEMSHVAAQASVAEGIKLHIEQLAERSAFISGRLKKLPRVDLLNELAKRLPDKAWLTDVHIQDNTLTMSGNASSATSLIKVLGASSLFANPHFIAPIVAWENGYERFEMSLNVRNSR